MTETADQDKKEPLYSQDPEINSFLEKVMTVSPGHKKETGETEEETQEIRNKISTILNAADRFNNPRNPNKKDESFIDTLKVDGINAIIKTYPQEEENVRGYIGTFEDFNDVIDKIAWKPLLP